MTCNSEFLNNSNTQPLLKILVCHFKTIKITISLLSYKQQPPENTKLQRTPTPSVTLKNDLIRLICKTSIPDVFLENKV